MSTRSQIIASTILVIFSLRTMHAAACSNPQKINEYALGVLVPVITTASICSSPRAVVDALGGIHVFAMDQNNHLIEAFEPFATNSAGNWTISDITSSTGATIQGVPSPLGLSPIQIFATSPSGHLLAFVAATNAGGVYSEFDLSAAAGSSAVLVGQLVAPILFGSTVHVFAYDSTARLHDFIKPAFGQWTDFNLSLATGELAVNPAPYAFGGNSIQVAARDTIPNGNMGTFIESVNADGTLASSSIFWGDLTAAAGGTGITGVPAPIVTEFNDVAIYVDDSQGHLVDYFKTQSAQWIEFNSWNIGHAQLSPTILYFPNEGPNGTVKIFTGDVDASGNEELLEFTGDPTTGVLTPGGGDLPFGNIFIFGDPHAVFGGNMVQVFVRQ